MIVFICARFWKLLLASKITQARLAGRTASSWILRHPWLLSSQAVWRASAALIVALFLMNLSLTMTAPDCLNNPTMIVLFMALLMAYWLAIAVMTWKLRHIQDGFFVVRELKMLGAVLLITNVITIAAGGRAAVPVVISSIIQLMIQTWYPLWKSYQMAQFQAGEALSEMRTTTGRSMSRMTDKSSFGLTSHSSLVDVLRHPDGFAAMKRFLTLEFSVENVFCWKQLHDHKRERSPNEVQAHFQSIYETFIGKGCPSEVNINSTLKGHFQKVYFGQPVNIEEIMEMKPAKTHPGSSPPDAETDIKLRLLKALYFEMIQLMQMDSYQRFRQTVEFQRLLGANPEHRTAMDRS